MVLKAETYKAKIKRNTAQGAWAGGIAGIAAAIIGFVMTAGTSASLFTGSILLDLMIGSAVMTGFAAAGSAIGMTTTGIWTAITQSPKIHKPEIPKVATDNLALAHRVKLSQEPGHELHVHEGKITEFRNGEIKSIEKYTDLIDEQRQDQLTVREL